VKLSLGRARLPAGSGRHPLPADREELPTIQERLQPPNDVIRESRPTAGCRRGDAPAPLGADFVLEGLHLVDGRSGSLFLNRPQSVPQLLDETVRLPLLPDETAIPVLRSIRELGRCAW